MGVCPHRTFLPEFFVIITIKSNKIMGDMLMEFPTLLSITRTLGAGRGSAVFHLFGGLQASGRGSPADYVFWATHMLRSHIAAALGSHKWASRTL